MATARSAPGRVATNTLVRAAGEAVAKLGSLAFYVVLARQLGSEDYGAFVFALALTGALLIGAGFGTDELIAREVARDRERAGRYLERRRRAQDRHGARAAGDRDRRRDPGRLQRATRGCATLLIGLGVAFEVMAKSWARDLPGARAARARLGGADHPAHADRGRRDRRPARGRRARRRGGRLLRRRAHRAGRVEVLLPALHPLRARRSRAAAAAARLLRRGLPIGVAGAAVRAAAEGRRPDAVVPDVQPRGRPVRRGARG